MSSEKNYSTGAVLAAFLVGGLVGAGVALLTAPQSGRETREKIREAAGEAKEKMRTVTDDAKNKIRSLSDDAKDKIHDSYQHGKDLVDEKRNIVSAAIEAGKKAMKEEKERLTAEG